MRRTPPKIECRPPQPGPAHSPEVAAQCYPALWAAAVALLERRGLLHGTDLVALAIEHRLPHNGESLIQSLCAHGGPARYVEYAPDHSQRAFAGLGPSAYQAPEVHPAAWYIGLTKS